jgi:hypothetical protein
MTTRNLPGSSDAAKHGTGDADLTVMLGAHAAFRRDLALLARAAAFADLPDPARRASVRAGWELFKRQLQLHHTAEDMVVWPALRQRLADSDDAQSVLDAMESEHRQIDPLLAAAAIATLPPPARLVYRAIWKPRHTRTSRWLDTSPDLRQDPPNRQSPPTNRTGSAGEIRCRPFEGAPAANLPLRSQLRVQVLILTLV